MLVKKKSTNYFIKLIMINQFSLILCVKRIVYYILVMALKEIFTRTNTHKLTNILDRFETFFICFVFFYFFPFLVKKNLNFINFTQKLDFCIASVTQHTRKKTHKMIIQFKLVNFFVFSFFSLIFFQIIKIHIS